MKLYSYFRSSASYRVRIALRLKGVEHSYHAVNLIEGEQQSDDYRARNAQGLIPALVLEGGEVIGQSTAILEWLEETHSEPPLYPRDALERARIRALCQHIACDVHPLNNLSVLRYLKNTLSQKSEAIDEWYAHWIHRGFATLETAVASFAGPYSLGENPGMLELFVVPQIYNARRFGVAVGRYENLCALDGRCAGIAAFHDAHPDRQPDTPRSRG